MEQLDMTYLNRHHLRTLQGGTMFWLQSTIYPPGSNIKQVLYRGYIIDTRTMFQGKRLSIQLLFDDYGEKSFLNTACQYIQAFDDYFSINGANAGERLQIIKQVAPEDPIPPIITSEYHNKIYKLGYKPPRR
jgi:hypothetical protein